MTSTEKEVDRYLFSNALNFEKGQMKFTDKAKVLTSTLHWSLDIQIGEFEPTLSLILGSQYFQNFYLVSK